ncbi:MAG: putative DNA-binding domain-containing protein, partial [Deltaproteobacteria bacterium]
MEPRTPAPRLADAQRRLWRLITAPEGVAAALTEAGDPDGRSLEALLASDDALDAAHRLDVYAHAYFGRIHECLAEDYGALASAIGAEAFHDLVTAYLLAHPPRHPSLRFAGEKLADFLAGDRRAQPFLRRWPWSADLARLEWALVDAFDAADAPTLSREDLARIPAARWPELRLSFQSSVQLLRLAWPVQRLREAWERDTPRPRLAAAERTAIGVWRHAERVYFRSMSSLEAELLEAALAKESFAALCARSEERLGARAAPAHAAEQLGRWIA